MKNTNYFSHKLAGHLAPRPFLSFTNQLWEACVRARTRNDRTVRCTTSRRCVEGNFLSPAFLRKYGNTLHIKTNITRLVNIATMKCASVREGVFRCRSCFCHKFVVIMAIFYYQCICQLLIFHSFQWVSHFQFAEWKDSNLKSR